ncbi:hypothetical protein ACIQUS_14245 [Pseudomonas sp. NPDC090755]|uniref:hypothetical protein n=1 Tax=Pseudomonas sp. NPDC090755 TaxID=3364481 RepID=UPI00383BB6ED
MTEDLQNALAFFQPAPSGWLSGVRQRAEDSGTWLWETLQGDFHDDPTTAQIVTGTVISMVPLVDQLCDIRDFIANCRKIDQDSSDTGAWIAMVLTLIGALPIIGSLFKGCLKVMFHAARRRFHSALKPTERDTAMIEQGVRLLDRYLGIAVVRKRLAQMDIYNIHQYLAEKVDALKDQLNVNLLLDGFKTLLDATRGLMKLVTDWAPASLTAPVQALAAVLERVSVQARAGVEQAIGPTRDYLDALANRLRVEADNAYRVRPGNNVHVLGQRADAELELMKQQRPEWVDEIMEVSFKPLKDLPPDASSHIAKGWPDIRENAKNPVAGKFTTFDDSLRASSVSGGERLYRVVEPGMNSYDNGTFWMREAEFQKLTSKGEWRRHFAVWKHWNENGEYVVYTVPPGQPLKVWEGRAATQKFDSADAYKLEGGREQILLNPDDLKPEFVSPRRATGWGYDDGTGDPDLDPLKPFLGLPELTHNWYPN